MTAVADPLQLAEERVASFTQRVREIRESLHRVVVGQDETLDLLLVCALTGSHALLVGVPGLAKTLMVKALASAFRWKFSRVQFTPDLMPSDITGYELLGRETDGATAKMTFRPGPVFANLVLADEINRAAPRTQSALLEAMAEKHVTVGGQTYPLDDPFAVFATQNPIEQEGTYPLPEAQLDRFMMEDVVPSELGWLVGDATLTEVGTDRSVTDALPEDNVRACVWEVRPAPAYVLITRQSEQQRPSSSYFLERALVPADVASRNASRWRRLDPARVDAESIGAAELIVMDHPGLLSVAAVNQLAALLRRGRGVLYVAAESSDATNLKRLTEAVGSGLQMPVEFAPAATGPARQALFVAEVRREVSP